MISAAAAAAVGCCHEHPAAGLPAAVDASSMMDCFSKTLDKVSLFCITFLWLLAITLYSAALPNTC